MIYLVGASGEWVYFHSAPSPTQLTFIARLLQQRLIFTTRHLLQRLFHFTPYFHSVHSPTTLIVIIDIWIQLYIMSMRPFFSFSRPRILVGHLQLQVSGGHFYNLPPTPVLVHYLRWNISWHIRKKERARTGRSSWSTLFSPGYSTGPSTQVESSENKQPKVLRKKFLKANWNKYWDGILERHFLSRFMGLNWVSSFSLVFLPSYFLSTKCFSQIARVFLFHGFLYLFFKPE